MFLYFNLTLQGGAIYVNTQTITISNCYFNNNYAAVRINKYFTCLYE